MMTNAIIPALLSMFMAAPAGDSKEEIRLFWATYHSKQSTEAARIEAINGLSYNPNTAKARILGNLLVKAPTNLRIEAAKTLTRFRGIKGIERMVEGALRSFSNRKRTGVRAELVRTLGSIGNESSLPILHKMVEDRKFEVARAALDALSGFKNEKSVRHLIRVLQKSERSDNNKRTEALNKTLRALTGRAYEGSREWRKWWGSTNIQTPRR